MDKIYDPRKRGEEIHPNRTETGPSESKGRWSSKDDIKGWPVEGTNGIISNRMIDHFKAPEESFAQDGAVHSPSHYNTGSIEVIDLIESQGMGKSFVLGNAIKYILRAGKKDPSKEVQDLQKAIWYLERRIKQVNRGDNEHEKTTAQR